MRNSVTIPFIALCAVAIAGWSGTTMPPNDMASRSEIAEGCDYDLESVAGRIGGFYTNFWPGGIVPYQFVTGSTDSIPATATNGWTRVLSDVTFSIPFSGPQLSSPTGFPLTWSMNDIVRCEGSTRNDNRDMKIVGGTLNASQTAWSIVQVELQPGSTFSAEAPSPNVKFFVTLSVSEENQALFAAAAIRWEEVANIDLRPWQPGDSDYLSVYNFNINSVRSDVGHGSGPRDLAMTNWTNRRTITHEIGHSLGAKHEHQRPDRNNYVTVDTTQSTQRGDNNLVIDDDTTIYPDLFYDYGSIMHYSQNAFRIAGMPGPVISINDPDDAAVWQTAMGTVDSLSYWDKTTMSFMYPESNWRFLRLVNLNPPSNGQFQSPWTVFDTAVADTPVGGRLIILNPRSYIEPGVYSKPMTIVAPQGGVTIRAN